MTTMIEAAAELDAQGVGDQALSIGDDMPGVALTDVKGNTVSSADFFVDNPAIITFYRGGWCPYCNLELKAYQALLDDIKALGAALVAVTPEKPDSSLSTIEKNELSFPVLTDTGNALAKAIGIQFEFPEKLVKVYEQFGLDLSTHNDQTDWALPIPATFVVDRGGRIVLANVNRDYRERLEPSEAIAALKSCVS